MPIEMQSKLLRFLQDKTFWRLGGQQQLHSDVRIVAAMNEAPVKLIQQERLRADLLSVERRNVNATAAARPPGRYSLLANYFIDKYRNDVPQDIHGLSETARADLLNHAAG